jgi:hypothetical protein
MSPESDPEASKAKEGIVPGEQMVVTNPLLAARKPKSWFIIAAPSCDHSHFLILGDKRGR